MSEAQDVTAAESSSQQSLESLGYRQELKRVVNSLGHIALILSDITPTASLLVVGTAVVATAGTGSGMMRTRRGRTHTGTRTCGRRTFTSSRTRSRACRSGAGWS